MNWFQLDPQSILARAKSLPAPAKAPTLSQSILRGAIGLTIVSVAGFLPWVLAGNWFYRNPGEIVMYSSCAIIFIVLSGLVLHPLLIGRSLTRFYQFFSIAFAAYSIAWIGGWLGLRGQHMHVRSAVGLLAGTAVLGVIFAIAFEARNAMLRIIAALFILNSLGYFVGGWIEGILAQRKELHLPGIILNGAALTVFMKAMWGVCYGLGFGSGLGFAFYTAQSKAREMINSNA